MNVEFELNIFEIIILVINMALLVLYLLNCAKLKKLRKNYSDFMTKLGKGQNINEMLEKYVEKVMSYKTVYEIILRTDLYEIADN